MLREVDAYELRMPRCTLGLAFVAASCLASAPTSLHAQVGTAKEAALFLLAPVGARNAASGQAAGASELGSESLWSNPAGISRMGEQAVALHHSSTLVFESTTLAIVHPTSRAGVVALSAQLFDNGEMENTDPDGTVIGQSLLRSFVLSGTYAATLGVHARVGATYKLIQSRVDCTGGCINSLNYIASTTALDIGLQFATRRADSLSLGIAIREFGPKLQIKDNAQADPLPTRVHLAAQGNVSAVQRVRVDATLRWAVEMVDRTSLDDPSFHVGCELGLQRQFFLRAGFASGTGDAAGPVFGLGFIRGKLALDFARGFFGLSADAGTPPTYLSLHVTF